MKVKCISPGDWFYWDKNFFGRRKKKEMKGPQVGDVVTVVHEAWDSGQKYYSLMEWPNTGVYNSKHFKPLEEEYESVTYEKIREKEKLSVN